MMPKWPWVRLFKTGLTFNIVLTSAQCKEIKINVYQGFIIQESIRT